MHAPTRQKGVTTVEFAIVGGILMLLVFGIIEFGRMIFTMDVLQEGARRGARVAAVCQVGNAGVADAAVFANLPGLTTANVDVQYLDVNGNPTAAYEAIQYVRVRISGYRFRVYLPLVDANLAEFPVPAFTATLPRESLGIPKFGQPAACY
jgi:hypothetical protein